MAANNETSGGKPGNSNKGPQYAIFTDFSGSAPIFAGFSTFAIVFRFKTS